MKVSRLIPGRRSRSSQGDVGDQAAARSEVGRLGAEQHQSIGAGLDGEGAGQANWLIVPLMHHAPCTET